MSVYGSVSSDVVLSITEGACLNRNATDPN